VRAVLKGGVERSQIAKRSERAQLGDVMDVMGDGCV
jgi:hypothetical protein